jgi:hypothetical protein
MVDGLREKLPYVDKVPCDIPIGSLCKEVNRRAVTEDKNAAGVENAATLKMIRAAFALCQ